MIGAVLFALGLGVLSVILWETDPKLFALVASLAMLSVGLILVLAGV